MLNNQNDAIRGDSQTLFILDIEPQLPNTHLEVLKLLKNTDISS